MDSNDVDLVEFQRLRAEIDNRTTISETIILACITALGTGVSLLEKTPDIVLALSFVSSLLWLSWLAHTRQIYKLSGYIAMQLGPRFPHSPSNPALYWEEYSRMVDRVGLAAYRLSYPELLAKVTPNLVQHRNISWFIRLFFSCGPLLLFIYVFSIARKQCSIEEAVSQPLNYLRLLMVFGSLWVWNVARKRFKETDAVRKEIESAVYEKARTRIISG